MNRLLTILLLAAGTAYGQIDNPPTTDSIGLGPTNDVTFNRVVTTSLGSTTNPAIRIGASNTGFYSPTNGYLYLLVNDYFVIGANDDSINFSEDSYFYHDINVYQNAIVGGTLTATGNVTLSGVNNTMPNATNAASGSSLMTRDLGDDRYTTSIWLTQFSDNQTITNGGVQLLVPGRINSWSLGMGASVPSGFTEFRVVLGFGWLQNPATNSTNFPVFVRFDNRNAINASTAEAEHGTAFGRTDLYPTNAASTGLAGTLTRRAVFNTTNTVYSFISDWVTIPNTWQSNASSNGFYHTLGVAIANNTGGSITDNFNVNHPAVGLIEFRK